MKMACPLIFWLLATAAASAQDTPASWDWTTASAASQGMSSKRLEAMQEALASRGTKALLVARHGRIVLEWYAPNHCARNHTTPPRSPRRSWAEWRWRWPHGRLALDDRRPNSFHNGKAIRANPG